MLSVREVMTENVVTVPITATLGDVMDTMLACDVRHVPVVEDGALRGMVSDRDVRSVAVPTRENADRPRLRVDLAMSVTEVMQSDIISVSPEDELGEVVDLMIDYKVGAVPVSGDGEQLIGIVSYIDVLRAARDAL